MRKSKPNAGGVLALALVTASLGLAACGESDDPPEQAAKPAATSTAGDTNESPTTPREPTASPTGQRRAVADTVEAMYGDLTAGNAAGVCSVMSTAAKAQIAQRVPGGSAAAPADRSCKASLAAFLRAAAASGVLERTLGATVNEVKINGDSAVAKVSFGDQTGTIALTKERGQWRFGPGAIAPGQ